MKLFLKEKKNNRRFDRLTDFENPNPLGIKWRFYLFSIILKNASFLNLPYVALTSLIFIAVTVSPSFYPLFSLTEVTSSYSPAEAVFPYSNALSAITPAFIPTRVWILIVILFCLITIICFIICLFQYSFTSYVYLLLDVKIHLILLPFISGTVGYCIYVASNYDKIESSINIWYCAIQILVFPFYLILLSILNFAEVNSIVKANIVLAGWFLNYPFFQPPLIAFVSLIGYQCVNWPPVAMYVCVGVAAVLCFSVGSWVFVTTPFLLFLTNELLITGSVVIPSFLIVSVCFIRFGVMYSDIIVAVVPLYFLVVFLVVHLLFQRKRTSIQQVLSQISTDIEQLTMDSLQATLSPIRDQNLLATIIKDGLNSSNKAIISEIFIQYCLNCFPQSEWFLAYTAFLYAIIWVNEPNAYRFLLHLLSLETFSPPIEYLLFQYVYSFMQTSQTLSPMIARRLTKYRETVLKYVMAHKKFWLSALDSDSKKFNVAKNQMFRLFMSVQQQIRTLELLFPFCPAVRCELCLYEADLAHDITKADNEYTIASSLITSHGDYVTNSLHDSFMLMFPGARIMYQVPVEEPDTSDYKFLSFQEHYDNAHRQGVSINVNDHYLSSLTHSFKMSRTQPQINPRVDRIRSFIAYFLILVTVVVYILLFVLDHYIDPSLLKSFDDVKYLNEILNATTKFRIDINRIQFDVDLLINIINTTYSDISTSTFDVYNFYLFVLEHLDSVESSIMSYKYLIDNFKYLDENMDVISSCDNVNCSFLFLFSVIHEKSLFFLHSNDFYNLSKYEHTHNMNSLIFEISNVIDNIYEFVHSIYISLIENNIDQVKRKLYIVIAIDLFMAIVVNFAVSILLKRMKDNITDIIRITQPPIIQYVSGQFDKLLAFDKNQYTELPSYASNSITIPYVLMFFVHMIYPILVLVFLPQISNFEWQKLDLPEIITCTDDTQFLYYSLAKLEFSSYSSRSTPVSSYKSVVNSVHSCFHNTFTSDVDENPVFILIKNEDIRKNVIAVHVSIMFASIIVFLFFLRATYLDINTIKISRLLLKFIPNSAAQSNPVFVKLLRGQMISLKDVSEFTESIKIRPDDLSFFCVLYYDFTGKITHSLGDVNKYLTIDPPSSLPELSQLIISKCKEDVTFDEVENFFKNQIENDSLSVSFFPGHEITLIFSKSPDSIIIKDDSDHYEANSKLRMTKRLNKVLENSIPTNLNTIQKAVISMVTIDSEQNKEIFGRVKKIIREDKELLLVDTRNSVVVFLVAADVDEVAACNKAVMFVKNTISSFVPFLKLAMTFGGPLHFFDSVKNQTTKSRCVGRCYDYCKMMLSNAQVGRPMISKDVFDVAELDTSEIQFVERKVASDITVIVTV